MIERLGQSLFLPTVLFGFAFFATGYFSKLPADAQLLISYLPYASLLLVAFIASAFNRGRTLIATIFALMLLSADQYQDSIQLLDVLMLTLLPLNLAVLACLPERGTMTTPGMLRMTFILALIAGVTFLADRYAGVIQPYVYLEIIPVWSSWFNPAQPAVLVAIASVLLSLGASYRTQAPITNSLFGACAGFAVLLILDLNAATQDAFVVTMALLLAIGLMRDYYNMAYRDELTALPQRRALNESMTSLSGRYSIAMLDVDHFKKFNDTHGHDVGDQVLQMVASQIRKVQGGGKAYRYGGEEFTVVFQGKSVDDASYYLDQVRKNIEGYEMVIREKERPEAEAKDSKKGRQKGSYRKADKKVSVTISIGAAEKASGERPDDVLKRADEALYRAKKGGRNQVAT